MSIKKFRSNGKDIRVSSILGHAAIISNEFRELPEILWADAYSQGAISDDMTAAPSMKEYIEEKKKEQEEKEEKERNEIKKVLASIFSNPRDLVDNKGNPIHRKVVQLLGKPIKRDTLDLLWSEVVKESDGE